jgi:non-heme chloroperoxidase
MPYITAADGTNIFYKDVGTGDPIILIHGWPLNSDMWEYQTTFLAESGYRVIAYDRRGFGRSDQTFTGHDFNTLSDDLASLINTLELTNVTLVGFSMGGGEVIRYLTRHGAARVRKGVLVSAVPPFLLKTSNNPEGVDPTVFDTMQKNILKDRYDFLTTFGPMFFGRSAIHHTVSESVLNWNFAMAIKGSLKATLEGVTTFSSTDMREEMKSISVPMLVIHGTGDSTVPAKASGARSAKLLPNATYIEYDGEPHGLFITAKDRINNDLLNFAGGDRNTVPKLAQI